jgi:hypothetical protein
MSIKYLNNFAANLADILPHIMNQIPSLNVPIVQKRGGKISKKQIKY